MAANVPPAAAVPPIPPPAGAVPPVPPAPPVPPLAAAPVPPVVPAAVPFSLAPGLATTTVLNYLTPEASKLFVRSTKPLSEVPYNCEPEHIKHFLECLSDRTRTAGWSAVIEVPPDLTRPDDVVSLIEQHGKVTLEQVMDHAATYLNANNRAAQDSFQLYTCLASSLGKLGSNNVKQCKEEYTINDTPSGPAFLKVIIRESQSNSTAATSLVRTQLSSLDNYMVTIDSDITKFNQHVKDCLNTLHQYGQSTLDLTDNLYKGYLAASDSNFIVYIKQKYSEYQEGKGPANDIELMQLANERFKVLSQAGTWNANSDDDDKIIALEAQVKMLSTQVSSFKPDRVQQTGRVGPRPSGTPGGRFAPPSNTKPPPKQGNGRNRRDRFEKNPWMKVPLKPGESHTKNVGGKAFKYCDIHKAWGQHSTAECKGHGLNGKSNGNNSGPGLKLARAYAAIVEEDDFSQE